MLVKTAPDTADERSAICSHLLQQAFSLFVAFKKTINPFFGRCHPLKQARMNMAKLHAAGRMLGTLLHGYPHRQELRCTHGKGHPPEVAADDPACPTDRLRSDLNRYSLKDTPFPV